MQVYCFKGMSTSFFFLFSFAQSFHPKPPPHKKKEKEKEKGELKDIVNSVVEGAGRRKHWGDEWCCKKLNKIILKNKGMGTANEHVSQHASIESCVLMARRICIRFSARYLYFTWTNKNPTAFIPWSKFFATGPFFFFIYYTLFHITTCLSDVCHKCRLKTLRVYPITKI